MKDSSPLEAVSRAVAKVTAFVATFFLFPPVFEATIPLVEGYAHQHYGYDMVNIAHIGWVVLCAVFLFVAGQYLITLALRLIPFLISSNR